MNGGQRIAYLGIIEEMYRISHEMANVKPQDRSVELYSKFATKFRAAEVLLEAVEHRAKEIKA